MITQETLGKTTVGSIVAEDFRTAAIFKKAGIDFCCGGNMTLEQACKEKNVEVSFVETAIEDLQLQPVTNALNFNDWALDFLCDYIKNTHHKYILNTLPDLMFYVQKVASVHGVHHPEMVVAAELFSKINKELLQHLDNEENVLFPAIASIVKNPTLAASATIVSEILRMTGEHEFAGGAMDEIAVITDHYAVPEDACNTYRVTLKLLEQFEDDLHVHVHLENNILYPKALVLAHNQKNS